MLRIKWSKKQLHLIILAPSPMASIHKILVFRPNCFSSHHALVSKATIHIIQHNKPHRNLITHCSQ